MLESQTNPIVSVILINYNSTHHTINCVKSIKENTHKDLNYEIILVDNNSRAEERKKLTDWLSLPEQKDIFFIQSDTNTGFTGGNMMGINQARGKYIYLLNNDCILHNDVLSILTKFMDENLKVAAVSPTMLNNNKKHTPAFSYMPSIATKWLGNSIMNKINSDLYPNRKTEYTQPVKVQVISGASMFLRKNDFAQVGYMDPNFFLYLEEEDLCMKLAKAGFEIYHVPAAIIQHLGGESTNRNYDIAKEYYISLYYFLSKHYSHPQQYLIKARYILREFFGSFGHPERFKLFLFLLKGAPMKKSLKYKKQ